VLIVSRCRMSRYRFEGALALGALAPRNRPSVLRSSSISGQWIPYPPPAIYQFFRWLGVAFSKRGYQTSSTLMTRPSRSETVRASSLKATSSTRSSAVIAEELIHSWIPKGSPIALRWSHA
jgi:hypothetical protein